MGAEVIPFDQRRNEAPLQAVPLPSMQQWRPIARIQAVVAASYGVDVRHMKSDCRCRSVSWPRQVAMCLTRELTEHSLPSIGRHFGNRDHSTVISAIRAVEKRMAAEPIYRADVEALREALSK